MYENNSKDICSGRCKLDYALLSLISDKINVGIIGAGRAGIIKAVHFLNRNCNVYMITKESYKDNEKIKSLMDKNNFHIKCREYNKDFILDKHLIIIAVDNYETKNEIKEDCDKLYKIYIDSTDFKEGLAVVPVQRETNNLSIGINTKGGNPKGSVFVAEKLKENVKSYDGFIQYTTVLRNKFKEIPEKKNDALKFIFSDDFYFFYKMGKGEDIIKLFYDEV